MEAINFERRASLLIGRTRARENRVPLLVSQVPFPSFWGNFPAKRGTKLTSFRRLPYIPSLFPFFPFFPLFYSFGRK